jgi:predicted MFS family arabinose efflux permease
MSTPAQLASSPDTTPVSAFQFRDFRLFQAGRLAATLGLQMQGVAVGWQVYAITGSALDLGYVGLVQFMPALLMSLLTGHVADRFNRRHVLLVCYTLMLLCTTALFVSSRSAHPSVHGIYAVLFVIGTARAFLGPASSALLPNLVPRANFPSAVAWSSSTFQVAVIAGPALGGLLYSVGNATQVYGLAIGLQLLTVLVMSLLRVRETQSTALGRRFSDLVAGLRYVWEKPVILGAISLDLFAVLFGGAVALLPIYARDILHIGPQGMGLLRSAPAIGALVVGVLLAQRPLRRHAGRAMFACVGLFGLATVVFGLSHSFVVSLLALVVSGAADMVSVFVRQSLVQLRTPDEMRGRVAAVNLVFVGASNELGEFESGLTAAWLGVVPAVVAGGIGTLLIVALWLFLFPALRDIDRLDQAEAP